MGLSLNGVLLQMHLTKLTSVKWVYAKWTWPWMGFASNGFIQNGDGLRFNVEFGIKFGTNIHNVTV
jgi:hypothetical protein